MGEIWFGKNRIFPSACTATYELSNIGLVYSDGGTMIYPDLSNCAYITGNCVTKYDGVIQTALTRNVSLEPVFTYTSIGKYFSIVNNRIYFNKTTYGTTDLYSTFGNYLTAALNYKYDTLSGSGISVKLYSNRITSSSVTRTLTIGTTESTIPATGGTLHANISAYTMTASTYSSNATANTKTDISGTVSLYYSTISETSGLTYITGTTARNVVISNLPANEESSERDLYIVARMSGLGGYTTVEQGAASLELYYDDNFITYSGTVYANGASEITIEDRGVNNRDYTVTFDQENLDYSIEDNYIYIENITETNNATVIITANDGYFEWRFKLNGDYE